MISPRAALLILLIAISVSVIVMAVTIFISYLLEKKRIEKRNRELEDARKAVIKLMRKKIKSDNESKKKTNKTKLGKRK